MNLKTKSISNLLAVALLLGAFVFFLPISQYGSCVHHTVFGFDCPGCGMTTAVHHFIHFQWMDAARNNLAVFTLIPLIIVEGIRFLGIHPLMKIRKWIYGFFIVSISIVYSMRLIDFIFQTF